jgi:hypothetical protein
MQNENTRMASSTNVQDAISKINALRRLTKDTGRVTRRTQSLILGTLTPIKTESPTQKLILLVLASHAGADGSCWPSYKRLMSESGFTSKSTITDALQYLRDTLKIVTWRKGWGNLHRKGVSNVYQFDFQAIKKLSDESPSDADESPSEGSMKVHLTGDEIPPRRSLSTSR